MAFLNGIIVHGSLSLKNLVVKFTANVFAVSSGLPAAIQAPIITYGSVADLLQPYKHPPCFCCVLTEYMEIESLHTGQSAVGHGWVHPASRWIVFFSTCLAALQLAELIVLVTDVCLYVCLSVCLSVVKRFANCYSYSFRPFLTKVGTHDLCVNTKNNCGTDFQNCALKILGEFLKLYVRSRASRPICLL